MRFYHIFLLILLTAFFFCCKKKTPLSTGKTPNNDTTQAADSATNIGRNDIPFDSVKWVVYYRGSIVGGPGGYYFDTAYHFTITITPSGSTRILGGNLYYIYDLNVTQVHTTSPQSYSASHRLLAARNDTVENKIFSFLICDTCSSINFTPPVTVDFNKNINDTIGAICTAFKWPINSVDTNLLISGKQYKRWTIKKGITQMFYQSYLVGGQSGYLPLDNSSKYTGQCSQLEGLDFIYKSDSLHFDYDYGYTF